MWKLKFYFLRILQSIAADTNHNGYLSTNTTALMQPTLMHYELHLQCVAQLSPYKGQFSCSIFTVTTTWYIQVTQNSHLFMEPASLYKYEPVTLLFHDYFIILPDYAAIHPG